MPKNKERSQSEIAPTSCQAVYESRFPCDINNLNDAGFCVSYDDTTAPPFKWYGPASELKLEFTSAGAIYDPNNGNRKVNEVQVQRPAAARTATVRLLPQTFRDHLHVTVANIVATCDSNGAYVQILQDHDDQVLNFRAPDAQHGWVKWSFDYTSPTLQLKVTIKRL
jgi:hypothetical protein